MRTFETECSAMLDCVLSRGLTGEEHGIVVLFQ